MSDTSIFDIIDGEEISKQEKIFDTVRKEVEARYPDFFKNKPDIHKLYEHNKLHNYITWTSDGTKSLPNNKAVKELNLSISDDLPEEIKLDYLRLVDERLKEFNQNK